MVFAFWIVFVAGYLVPFIPKIPWEEVSGYFNFAVVSFVPAIVPYLVNQYFNRKERAPE